MVAVACICIFISKSFLGYAYRLLELLLFLFSDCRSYVLCHIWFRFCMAHFSSSGDSITSLFFTERIGFERCTSVYLVAFVLLSPAICFCR